MLKSLALSIPLAFGLTVSAFADHHKKGETDGSDRPNEGGSLFTSTFLGNYEFTTGRIVELAEAIPSDVYDWAPSEGVRSVEKAILHIAAANYMLGSKLGAQVPEGIDPQGLEKKSHDKATAVRALKDSIAFAKRAVSDFPAKKLGEEAELFGMTLNHMSIVLIIGSHANEHLGQLIAYARSNDIAPPWNQ